jgi:hypothetical protein
MTHEGRPTTPQRLHSRTSGALVEAIRPHLVWQMDRADEYTTKEGWISLMAISDAHRRSGVGARCSQHQKQEGVVEVVRHARERGGCPAGMVGQRAIVALQAALAGAPCIPASCSTQLAGAG